MRGPGIVKVNTKILDDPAVVLQIGTAIEEMMGQTDNTWNPHASLEFLKVAICLVFSFKSQSWLKLLEKLKYVDCITAQMKMTNFN